jgi:hypothetical protein
MRTLPTAFRKHQPIQKKFVLASSDIIEINHFLDKYSLEWTRFGNESREARRREFAGTTRLPEIYSTGQVSLDDNLEKARKAGIEDAVHGAALRLMLSFKDQKQARGRGLWVLDEENRQGTAMPHYFHNQCFVGADEATPPTRAPAGSASPTFRVTDADLAIFQPRDSAQVPKDYYAVDLRLRLRTDSGESMPIVCRFPSTAIDVTLLEGAKHILSSAFSITLTSR